ncbi:MAG: EscU/YscU/HrcU family type III secretion system export apparatus switch protein [Pseudomonadota bacterium]
MGEPGRNLPPTRKKLLDARKRGDIPRYRDFLCYVSLLAGAAAVLWIVPGQARRILLFAQQAMAGAVTIEAGEGSAWAAASWFHSAGKLFLTVSASVCLPVFALTLLAGLFSTRFAFSVKPIAAQLDRLNPLEGAKKFFSSERWMGLAKDLLKIVLIAASAYFIVDAILEILPAFIEVREPGPERELLTRFMRVTFLYTFLALVPILFMDFIYTRHAYLRRLMMTGQELKKELRETEGDPSIKGRRQKLHREIALQRMIEEVKRAAVVIVNPLHIAVALRWEEETMDAPVVVAAGKEHMARRIIREARRCGVPVIQDIRLAGSLSELQVGEEIPENLYEVVAKVIRLLED